MKILLSFLLALLMEIQFNKEFERWQGFKLIKSRKQIITKSRTDKVKTRTQKPDYNISFGLQFHSFESLIKSLKIDSIYHVLYRLSQREIMKDATLITDKIINLSQIIIDNKTYKAIKLKDIFEIKIKTKLRK